MIFWPLSDILCSLFGEVSFKAQDQCKGLFEVLLLSLGYAALFDVSLFQNFTCRILKVNFD